MHNDPLWNLRHALAGVGENPAHTRERSCRGLQRLGIHVDPERNNQPGGEIREISPPGSEVRVLVIPTNEELRIAQETKKVIESKVGIE